MSARLAWLIEHGNLCCFGATELVVAGLVTAGVGSTTAAVAAPIIVGTVAGAAGGAGLSAATGGDPGQGALLGAATGGGAGIGGELLGPTIGSVGGAAVGGAAGGAVGGAVTGADPLKSAALGGVSGAGGALLSSATGGAGATGTPGDAGAATTATGAPISAPDVQPIATADTATALSATAPTAGAGVTAAPATDLGSVTASAAPGNVPGTVSASAVPSGLSDASASAAGPASAGSSLTNTALGPIGQGPAESVSATSPGTALSPSGPPPLPDYKPQIDPNTGLATTVASGEANTAGLPTVQPPSLLDRAGNFITSNPSLALAGAPLLLSELNQPKVPPQFAPLNPGGAVTGPLIATEQARLNEANTGILQPGEAAQIEQYRQQAEAQLRQQLANEGVADPTQDSRFIQGMATIQQNVQIQRQQFITAALQAGTTAAGDASSALVQAGNAQVQQDSAFTTALANASESFGLIAALGKAA